MNMDEEKMKEIEEQEECHLFKGTFFALLFEGLGIMVIWGLIKIVTVIFNAF